MRLPYAKIFSQDNIWPIGTIRFAWGWYTYKSYYSTVVATIRRNISVENKLRNNLYFNWDYVNIRSMSMLNRHAYYINKYVYYIRAQTLPNPLNLMQAIICYRMITYNPGFS